MNATAAASNPPAPIRRKPSRAETARANGALSRGPATEEGKRRSAMNGLLHGLRARRHLAVEALGESAPEAEAHMEAVRAELGAVGPIARHLAETAACSTLRVARAERLEGELLAGLAENGGSVAKALHADRDARATLALLQRYRREADGELRRSLDALVRLHRARNEDMLPGWDDAAEAEADLDDAVAELPAPSEPRIVKIEPREQVSAVEPANDDAAPRYTGRQLLALYRGYSEERRAIYWRNLSDGEREAMVAAAREEAQAKAEGRDPETLRGAADAVLLAS